MNTILVVEDDAIIGEDIQRTLQRLGYEVGSPQRSGTEALRSIEAKLPDLVLMDIRLQGQLDGIQTTALIRKKWDVPVGMTGVDFYHTIKTANPGLADRIVFLTGGAFSEAAEAFLESCANLVVLKPFKVLELRRVVADYVGSADQVLAAN